MSRRHFVIMLGASLVIAAGVVRFAGGSHGLYGPGGFLPFLSSPVFLPIWGVWLLCLPAAGLVTALARKLILARLRAQQPPIALAFHPGGVNPEAPELAPDASFHGAAEPLLVTDSYQADAVFGVVWRWYDNPGSTELLAYCPACDGILVPLTNGGSLSRGLHCEHCNKLRAAGEHPSEVQEKVLETLLHRRSTGEWRAAPRRIERARGTATRPLVAAPAA